MSRTVLTTMAVIAMVGAFAGLAVGLATYPRTAWAAFLEGGFLAAPVGGVIGVVAALAVVGIARLRGRRRPGLR